MGRGRCNPRSDHWNWSFEYRGASGSSQCFAKQMVDGRTWRGCRICTLDRVSGSTSHIALLAMFASLLEGCLYCASLGERIDKCDLLCITSHRNVVAVIRGRRFGGVETGLKDIGG